MSSSAMLRSLGQVTVSLWATTLVRVSRKIEAIGCVCADEVIHYKELAYVIMEADKS